MISAFYFNYTVSVERASVTKDKGGGATRDWAPVSGLINIAASVQPASADDIALYAGRQIRISHSVYLQSNPGIQRGDRLRVSDGRYLVVRGTLDAAGFGRLYKVVCRELLE